MIVHPTSEDSNSGNVPGTFFGCMPHAIISSRCLHVISSLRKMERSHLGAHACTRVARVGALRMTTVHQGNVLLPTSRVAPNALGLHLIKKGTR